jgi:capsid assembly protease
VLVAATPHSDTAVVDTPWDGPANVARLSNTAGAATYQREFAWVDPQADADTKAAYKLPHHEVDPRGRVGAANVNGVRAALSRLGQESTQIPEGDIAAVRANLQKHLDTFNSQNRSQQEFEDYELEALGCAVRVHTEGRIWAVAPRVLAALGQSNAELVSWTTLAALEAAAPRRSVKANGGIATVPLKGVLMPAASGLMALLFGGGGLDQFRGQLREASRDPETDAIVIDVDSPGGLVDQIPETAAEIRAARVHKPVLAVANTQAASAAYWLASQADEVVVTPSGEVGSIGVYQLHRDVSGLHAKAGITPTLVSAGKYKVEGNPYEPLTDEARAALQREVDDFYSMFTAEVAKGRGATQADVQAGYGEGRSLNARRAVATGLADRVDTLENTIRRISSPRGRAAIDQKRAETDVVGNQPAYTLEERDRLLDVLAQLR